jgi:hypothetical protein
MLSRSNFSKLEVLLTALLTTTLINCNQVRGKEISSSQTQDFLIAVQPAPKLIVSHANIHPLRLTQRQKDPQTRKINQNQRYAIANLADGNYQFCSQPDPKDWRVGAGVCFNFGKISDRVDGYYGYPHSDDFICVRGKVNNNLITGEALEISWAVNPWNKIPESTFKWDSEGRLTLSQGSIIRTSNSENGRINWILFPKASLNITGFYQYSSPKMTPPSQLCEWNLN